MPLGWNTRHYLTLRRAEDLQVDQKVDFNPAVTGEKTRPKESISTSTFLWLVVFTGFMIRELCR